MIRLDGEQAVDGDFRLSGIACRVFRFGQNIQGEDVIREHLGLLSDPGEVGVAQLALTLARTGFSVGLERLVVERDNLGDE